MARLLNWEEIKPGSEVYIEERPTGNWQIDLLLVPERHEILSRTEDDRLEIILYLDPAPEAYHGYQTKNDNIRIWDSYPSRDEREAVKWE